MRVPSPPFEEAPKPQPVSETKRPLREVWVITPSGWAVAQTQLPTVTVLVPVLNEARYLRTCLDCIFNQDYPPELVEVLVIDGGSTDGTREIVRAYRHRHPNLRLLVNPDGVAAAALNRGIQAASGDVIVRVDGHAFIAPDYLRRCVYALEATGADAVGGVLHPVGETPTGRAIAAVMAHPLGGGPAPFRQAQQPVWADTVYLGAWRKETVHRVGGFNSALAANEDYEFYYRLRRVGGRVLCDPSIRSWTTVRRTFGQLWHQYAHYGFWKAQMLKQHPLSLRLRQVPAPLLVFLFWALWLLGWHMPWASRGALALLVAYGGVTALLAGELALRLGWRLWWRLWLAFWVIHWAWGMGFWRGMFTPLRRGK